MTASFRIFIFFLAGFILMVTTPVSTEEFTNEDGQILQKISHLLSTVPIKQSKTIKPMTIETPLEKTERVNKKIEKMIQFVNILGQIDSFITDRTKNFVKKLHAIFDVDEADKLRRSHSRF